MIRIRTGSRLHFGLLAPFQPGGERAGGCGLMVQEPGVDLTAEPTSEWRIEGDHAERVGRLVAELQAPDKLGPVSPLHLVVYRAAREHIGLGTGTQLTLAVVQALTTASGSQTGFGNEEGNEEWCRLTGRGRRSQIGVRGFLEGGFLVDAGPAVERYEFPPAWTFLLLTPHGKAGTHGPEEQAVFSGNLPARPGLTCDLESLLRRELLPALQAHEFEPFALALTEYNRRAGEFYRAVQGGCYSSPWITLAVERLRLLGVRGVGQSSWGPTVFALLPNRATASALSERLAAEVEFKDVEHWVTSARSEGVTLTGTSSDNA